MGAESNPAKSRLRNFKDRTFQGQHEHVSDDDRSLWSDEALMAAITAHDEQAFSSLYDRYADLVFSTSLRVLADSQLAEDTTQDVFVRLWQRPEAFVSARGRFLSWLMSVTRNRAVDELRSRGRRMRRETAGIENDGEPIGEVDHFENGPLHAAQLQEQQQRVRSALEDLPREQRRCLELAYFGGFTQQEIALRLHEPLGTVKTRIRLGMEKLRAALQDQR